jgi:hypothetical protein
MSFEPDGLSAVPARAAEAAAALEALKAPAERAARTIDESFRAGRGRSRAVSGAIEELRRRPRRWRAGPAWRELLGRGARP